MFEGVRRHLSIWKQAWKDERERKSKARPWASTDFLPAALEITERPASPIGRTLVWIIISFFTIALAWSYFGHVDIVASAPGRLIPKERVKVVQASSEGIIRAIHVDDGQRVTEGEALVELDPTLSKADLAQMRDRLKSLRIEAARNKALLAYLDGRNPAFAAPADLEPEQAALQQRIIYARIDEFEANIDSLLETRAQRISDLQAMEAELDRLRTTLPLLQQREAARRELMEEGLSPKLVYLQIKEELVSDEKSVGILQRRQAGLTSAIAALDQDIKRQREEFRAGILEAYAEAQGQIRLQEQELAKAEQRNRLQTVAAPVDGIVQQINVRTIGGVVQPADPLMVVVPGEGELVMEAQVLNKDIGFVNVGDPVEVKLEAFPFGKYGAIDGTLKLISSDAIQDEDRGLYYVGLASLASQTIHVDGKDVRLAPGMAATAEVKTGKRRVIEFLLSPLFRYRDESLRER